MLQHNTPARPRGDHAHIAHAAMVGMHALCCGLPALAMTLAAVSGAGASGLSAFAVGTGALHGLVHSYELWIVAVSALLVFFGGLMEWHARRLGHRNNFPWLFALSATCFVVNLAVILSHRGV